MEQGIHGTTACFAGGVPEKAGKERPILFSKPMVLAILEGRKTQTRRIVRKQFPHDAEPAEVSATSPEGWQISGHSGFWWDDAGACFDDSIRCPFGIPGDRLWIRETFNVPSDVPENTRYVAYRADACVDEGSIRWKPSIFMPRWASRITLEIVSVRVERLQGISEADALAEGIDSRTGDKTVYHFDFSGQDERFNVSGYKSAKSAYIELWRSINGAGSWAANPWVWCVEFKRVGK